jgi:hypothetical protein
VRRPLSSAILGHTTRARNLSSVRWQATCSCGWCSAVVRWGISARDAAAGHLLEVVA